LALSQAKDLAFHNSFKGLNGFEIVALFGSPIRE
jgi:hypothetical protein